MIRRFIVIGIFTVIWPSLFVLLFNDASKLDQGPGVLTWLGLELNLSAFLGILSSLSLTLILYSGNLIQNLLTGEYSFDFDIFQFRALIAAPVYEETIFRGVLIPAMICSGFSPKSSIFLSGLIFGVTHLYHLVEIFKSKVNVPNLVAGTFLQVVYTSIFGTFAAYTFLRTGSLFSPILIHAFCNYMGVPDLHYFHPNHSAYKHRVLISTAYAIGIPSFFLCMPLLMDPVLYNPWFYRVHEIYHGKYLMS